MQAAGLSATLCCPIVSSLIPDPFFAEPSDPAERLAALSAAIRRFARFDPVGVLVTTGQPGAYKLADVEVFSDNGLFGNNCPDSLWSRPAADVARDAVDRVMRLWNTRDQGA